jgi:DNA invertase Pin-like site-specific DNA recombinase
MAKTVAYIRVSTDKARFEQPEAGNLGACQKKDIKVDDFIEITISSRKTSKQRRIDELLEKLIDLDTLIVTELSRLGRSTAKVIDLINQLVSQNIRVIVIKQNLDLRQHDMGSKTMVTVFSLLAELSGI